ncbi:MAG: hypothetical protein ABH954_04735 [Candidatus Omnitrophota bacterium]
MEYAVLIAIIIAGLIAMQIYVRRSFAGRLRDIADSVGPQYWPGRTETGPQGIKTTQTSDVFSNITREIFIDNGVNYYVTRQLETTHDESTSKTGSERIYGP